MLRRFKQRPPASAHYHFFRWEGGAYVPAFSGEFPSDHEAIARAEHHASPEQLARPESLDRPHLHVIRQDGIHIITLDLSEPAVLKAAVGG